jgi:hypothetical protein
MNNAKVEAQVTHWYTGRAFRCRDCGSVVKEVANGRGTFIMCRCGCRSQYADGQPVNSQMWKEEG